MAAPKDSGDAAESVVGGGATSLPPAAVCTTHLPAHWCEVSAALVMREFGQSENP